MTTTERPQHLDDGALVRILDARTANDPTARDGQPPYDDLAAHLDACGDCRARYRTIDRRSQALHALLERARPAEPGPPADLLLRARDTAARRVRETPRHWSRAPALRAAAVATLIMASALAAEPVREWMGATARQLMAALDPATRPAPSTRGATLPPADSGIEVTIVPTGERLVLRFDAAEPGAVARVVFHHGSAASGQVLGDGSAPGLVALPDGFRARNAGARGTGYRFTAPVGMPVEVRVGDRVLTTLGGGAAGDEREVALEP